MHKIITTITHSGATIQLMLFVILFVFIWNIENIAGIAFDYKKWKHAYINFPFIFTDIPVQFILSMLFVKTILWDESHHFGFFQFFKLHQYPLLVFLISFVFLDFGEYIYHLIMHKVKRLWMFHLVHHSDQVLDVSTTLREHPGETFIRLLFTLLWVFIGGISMWVLILRQLIQAIVTPVVHMNYRLPERLDKIISVLFITPNLHQVHHHYKQPYTDCNYGDVLSIWDRLFGTLKRMPHDDHIKFGIDTYMETEIIGKFISLISLPFGKYRRAPNGDVGNDDIQGKYN